MPTINFSLQDVQNLVGKKLTIDELRNLLVYCKANVENYDKITDELTVELADTNLPYLWSVEGVARLLKGVLGKEKRIPELKVKKSDYQVIVDPALKGIRPYIVSFAVKGSKVSDYLIKQVIQLQEKLCENFGKRRQKVAIGIYRLNKIKFPVHYRATDPESVTFTPLDFRRAMTQQEILEVHPKGKDYAWILKGCKKYPLLIDSNKSVLSFPPIINSVDTGKIEEGDSELFFEATGTDLSALNLAANIFAQAFADRGFDIYSVDVKYEGKTVKTPDLHTYSVKLNKEEVKNLLGMEIKDAEIKSLLEGARYNFNNFNVEVPHYRNDILHAVDVVEDIAIMYGYDRIKELPLTTFTVGNTFELTRFINRFRELLVGIGYQETISSILSNTEILNKKMNVKDFGNVVIENSMSETFSCVRSWLTPLLIDILSKNKHVDYPQKIFEEGIVTVRRGEEAVDYERLAVVSAHNNANFTEVKQIFDYLMRIFGISYQIKETEHSSFIHGRVGRISVNGKDLAYIGEIDPAVLRNFNLSVPVAAFELNLTELFKEIRK